MFISDDGHGDVWSWYEAWEVIATLTAMCPAAAYSGATFNLGERTLVRHDSRVDSSAGAHQHLWVNLGPPNQGVSSS